MLKNSNIKYFAWLFLLVFACSSLTASAQDLLPINHFEKKFNFSENGGFGYGFTETTYHHSDLLNRSSWNGSNLSTEIASHSTQIQVKEKKVFSFSSISIPAVGIGYGIIALHKNDFKELNITTNNEILEDHPHFLTHADNYLQVSPAAAVIGLNIAGVHGANRFGDELCIYGISSLIMLSAVHIIKPIAHEERPDHSGFSSFPSGHTATAFAAAEWLRAEYWHHSPWIGIAGYAAATGTGALRVYNNRHWVSDVIAGAAIGFLSTRIAYAVNPWIEKHVIHRKNKQKKLISYTWLEAHTARPEAVRNNNKIPESQ